MRVRMCDRSKGFMVALLVGQPHEGSRGHSPPRGEAIRISMSPSIHLDNVLNSCNFLNAEPESIDSAAKRIPSFHVDAAPEATNAGAVFNKTTSRLGPRSPRRMPSTIF